MIRICHIITGLSTGGAEMMLYKLLSGTDRTRFESSVISLIDKGTLGERIEALGIPVYTLGMPRGWPHPSGLVRLVRLVRRLRPDLLQGWMYHGNLAASLAGLGGRVPVVWGIHYSPPDLRLERRATRAVIQLSGLLSRHPAATVYVSRASAERHRALGFRDRCRRIIPNGFDGTAFRPDPEARRRFRSGIGVGEQDLLIGSVARFHPMKDHGNLLRALTRLKHTEQRLRLVLAGPGMEKSNGELKAMVDAHGLSGQTLFLGERQEVADILAGLDILCLSSSHGEAFPLVVGEAMAAGLPCVVTNVGDAAWLVGDTGRVVPARDSEALASALAALIERGPAARRALGAAARVRVLTHFSLAATVGAYQDLYQRLVGVPDSVPTAITKS
ncbi:glycosyltransferase [Candidatus Methylocalor cossyra]|uniref:Glycosyltransferase involved in cell wall bisynthesis n=1 Tax=Candidatus Methylocalor cossyra TaxID=3108543 RepID=A0ABM9NES4_9GAMM